MVEQHTRDNSVSFSERTIGPVTAEWGRTAEETPVFTVVSAVAEAANVDMLELPPLYESIDPEALNDLFTARGDTAVEQVTFEYAGYHVSVQGNGEVTVESITNA
ncbi:HalOD1 output domain-containing protein [Natrialbaceae archaeon GCM10025810]|uniref:HalOD1 output domain-containing protein n=1 Tax=Halovalidus salilacus TaxID=3075124 RepID=UPI0036145D31